MTNPLTALRVGTRGSALARAQTALAVEALLRAYPALDVSEHVIKTTGDQVTDLPLATIAGGGVFTSALETALLEGRIDLAVHSAKDLPTDLTPGLILAAYLPRADVRDVLISREGHTLATLPHGALIGTSSPRRAAQLRAYRQDFQIRDLRGNIDTRIAKALNGEYDAIVLARAGLDRIGRTDVISETLSLADMMPAPGQGAICLQVRAASADLLHPVDHRETHAAVLAERAFLRALGGGCALPVAAYAYVTGDQLHLRGHIFLPDGSVRINGLDSVSLHGDWRAAAEALGQTVAGHIRTKDAGRWLGAIL